MRGSLFENLVILEEVKRKKNEAGQSDQPQDLCDTAPRSELSMGINHLPFLLSGAGFDFVCDELYAFVKLIAILAYHLDCAPVEMELCIQMEALPQCLPGYRNRQVMDKIFCKCKLLKLLVQEISGLFAGIVTDALDC